MKTKFLVSAILFFGYFANAEDSIALKTFHRFYVGASFTAECTYRHVFENRGNNFFDPWYTNLLINERNSTEHPMFGYKAGVRFGVNIFRWFGVETGLEYKLHQWYAKSYNGWYRGYWKTNFSYHYFDIPLALNFVMGKKKVRGIIQAGINVNCLYKRVSKSQIIINDKVVQTYQPGDTLSPNLFHRFNISPFLGIGIDWQLTKFLYLRIMPVAQMQCLKNIDFPITEYLWSAGVNTALLFGFRRYTGKVAKHRTGKPLERRQTNL